MHSSFSSLVQSLLPKETLLRTYYTSVKSDGSRSAAWSWYNFSSYIDIVLISFFSDYGTSGVFGSDGTRRIVSQCLGREGREADVIVAALAIYFYKQTH